MAAESSNEESSKNSRQFLQEIIEENHEYFYGSFGVTDVHTLVQRFLAETDLQQDIQNQLGYGPKTKIQHHCKVLSESIGGAEIPPLPLSTLAPDSASVHYLAASLSKLSQGESINDICTFLSTASQFHQIDSVQMAGPCQPFLRLNETAFDTITYEEMPSTSSSENTPTSSCGDAWYALTKTPQALIICFKYTGKADAVLMSLGALFRNLSLTNYAIPTPPNFECLPIILCQIVDLQESSSQNIAPLLIQGVLKSLPDTYSDPKMPLLLPCQWNESDQDPPLNPIRSIDWTVTPTQLVASTITPERVYARVDGSGNQLEATLTVYGNFLSNIKSISTTETVFVDSSWRLVQHTDQMIQLSVKIYSFDSLKDLTLRFDSFDYITTGPFTLPPENIFSTNASLGYLLTDQVDKSLFTRAVVVFAKQLYQLKVTNPNFHSLPDERLPSLFVQFVKADEIAGGKRMRSNILEIVKDATEFDSLLETIEDCAVSTYERILRFANQWPAISKTWGSILFDIQRMAWADAERSQFILWKGFFYLFSISFYLFPPSILVNLIMHPPIQLLDYFLRTPDSGYSALLDFFLLRQTEFLTEQLLAQRKLTDPGSLCRAKYLLSLILQNSKLNQAFQHPSSLPSEEYVWFTFNSKNRVAQSLDMIKCISTIQEELLRYIQVVVIGFQDAGKSSLLEGMFDLDLGSSSTKSTTTISTVQEYEIGPCTISILDTPGLNDLSKTVRATGKQVVGRASIYLLVISAAELDRPNFDHVAAVQQLSGCTSLDYVLVFLTKIDFQDRTTESLNQLVDRYSAELNVPRQNFCLTSMAHKARSDNHVGCLKLNVCNGKKAKSWLLRQLCRFGLVPKESVDNLELQSPLPLHVASASCSPLPSSSSSSSSSFPPSSSSSSSSSSFSPPGPSSPSSSSSSPASPVPYELTSHIRSSIENVDVDSIVEADFLHPFFPGETVNSFKVLKVFLDGASRPRLLELSDLSKVLYKNSDDLRLDKFVLTMMQHFNECWEQEQLLYKWYDGHAGSLLRNITYQVQPLGTKGGFIQFISNSHSVLPLYNRSLLGGSRNYNDWKFDEHGNLLATAAAAYLSLFILNVGDTHQSNMLLTDSNELVAIDFAFLHESPLVDTSYFPIPVGLKELMRTQNQWDSFKSLCWKGLQALKKHSEELIILCRTAAKAVDPRLLADAPRHLHYSLNYSREELFSLIEKGTRLAIPKNILQIFK